MILYYQENVARDADARLLVRLTREVTRETAGETDTADAAAEDFEAAVEAAGKDAEENRKYSLLSKLRTFCRKTCYRCGETHCSRSGRHVRGMDIFQENLPSIRIIPVRMVISVLLLYCPVFLFAVSLFLGGGDQTSLPQWFVYILTTAAVMSFFVIPCFVWNCLRSLRDYGFKRTNQNYRLFFVQHHHCCHCNTKGLHKANRVVPGDLEAGSICVSCLAHFGCPALLRYPGDLCQNLAVGIHVELQPEATFYRGGNSTTFRAENMLRGLLINETTGMIAGSAISVVSDHNITVIASNAAGTCSVTLIVHVYQVTALKATQFLYSGLTIQSACRHPILICFEPFCADATVTTIACGNNTHGLLFEVEPVLPKGLVLNPHSGQISGTPIEECAHAEYCVRGGNRMGSVDTKIVFSTSPNWDDDFTRFEKGLEASSEEIQTLRESIAAKERELEEQRLAKECELELLKDSLDDLIGDSARLPVETRVRFVFCL